ncbi:MAG: aminotransferase class III-fold pyridoxal phosphate-dependent enzyme [Bryobacteraceae bacterium]
MAEIFEGASGISPAGSNSATTFRAMGYDALALTKAAQGVTAKFGVKVALGQLVDQQSTLAALTEYLSLAISADQFDETFLPLPPGAAPEPVPPPAPAPGTLATILSDQLQAMTLLINRQLDVLQRAGGALSEVLPAAGPAVTAPGPTQESTGILEISPAGLLGVEPEPEPAPALRLTPAQESYLGTFVARYVSRTKKSKDLTQQYRARLADPRAAAGFRTAWKELVYPIVTQHSRGSRLWDLNGNEYIDIVNGFGPTLFGHAPDFVVNAVRSQLDRGFEIGPQSPIAGKVAAMLCEITGMERATFCNTGSEAVMAAIRVARSVTGRARIVMFSGAYHGIFDEVLARGAGSGTAPISSGIPARNLQNVTVLEYAAESSLQWIQENGAELAAVLVEPVQSRNPGLQPKEFLEQLRDVTTQCGAALIFDEGTTGFRVHSGGVQALFGIRADLATYGKVLGGGLPIGALAGSAKFMDSLDGGAWSFGDDSSPDDGITFFGGTFVRHPLALAAAEAVLDHLQEQGPELQERLNAKTGRLVAELNTCFKEAGLPSRVESFGSIFYFQFPAGEPLAPLFFYHLRANGLYILEGYPCFLTTAHTESDVKNIVEIFRHSIREMVEGGLFPPPPEKAALPDPDSPVVTQGGSSQAASSGGDSPGALNQISNVPLPGELDIPTLRNAVFAVCARRLTPACEAVVPIVDLSALEPAERAESWQQYTLEASRMPFVAGEAPLRITLLRLQRDEHVLVLSTPGDAPWAADSAGDEIVAEHERAKAEAERVEAYWLAQFRQLPAPFDLPTDRPRLTGRPFHTATCRTFVSEENAHRIECLGRNHGCTLFVTLLSGFHATLQRLAGRDVTVIGVPVAAQACGRVANVLPLLARSDTSTTVEQFLNQTKRTLVDACNHDAYSYDKLARKLDLFADESRVPLMEVQFHLEQATSGAPVEAQPVANFDLFLKVTTLPAGLIVDCDYRTDLFDESTIRRWLSHFESFLVNASADPSQCVQRVALMNAEETAAVLTGWKRASREYPNVRVIHELFEEQVAANPSAIAITMDGQRCTYGDLNSRANQLARYLRKYGVGPETPVGICMERCVDMLVGLLGILKSGGGYVPLDPDAPPERLRQLMEHAQSRFVITQLALLRHFSAPGIKGICMEADWPFIAQENEQNPPPAALPDHLFGAIYGPPTGGELNATAFTHRNVARLFAATDERFCFEPSDVWGLSSPATSASSIWEIWGCLLYGSRLVMISADAAGEPQELSRLLKEEGITVLNQSPSAFRKLVDAVPAESGLPLRLVIVSGEPNTIGNLQRWVDSATEVVYMHGATESTIYCSCKSIGTEEAGAGSANVIGQPLPDVEVYVLDRNLNPAPIGIEGELCIGGAGLARGYWRREDLTREHFLRDSYSGKPHGRFFRTGDLARLLPSGEIEYRGRLAGQQEPRENFSDPKDIELALRRNAAVLDVMVIVRDDEAGDGRLTAYVVPRDRSITVRELRDSLADSHPGLGIPPSFVLMEALPLTADGQLDRTALPVPDNRNWSGRGYTAPRTPTEKALAQIWAEVLRLERVGVDDDILDLGGNSGHVAQISSRAKAAGISVSPQQLVEYGTVARVLAEAEPAGKDSGFRLMEKAS